MLHIRSIPLAAGCLLASIAPARADIWNQNLVVNGDAESGAGTASKKAAPPKDVPGWTISGSFTLAQYNTGSTGADKFQSIALHGPMGLGKQFFVGGNGGGPAKATQTIDVSAGATEIDAGRVRFYLSAAMGNGRLPAVVGHLKAALLDGAGKTLLESEITGPTAAQSNTEYMQWRSGSGFVLPNTRKVLLTLDLSSEAMTFNGASADNISFTLALESVLGANLVVNGDAEMADGATGDWAVATPGWNSSFNSTEGFSALVYSQAVGAGAPGPDDRGKNVLWADSEWGNKGANGGVTVAYQTIDVTLAKDRVDAGGVTCALSGWLGGKTNADDPVTVQADFLDAAGNNLAGGIAIGPVTAQDRGNKSALLLRSAEGGVPPSTRIIRVTLTIKSLTAASTRGYADNIAVFLKSGGAITIKDGGIVNTATGLAGPVAPGEMITVYTTGINLATTVRMRLDDSGNVSTNIGNVRLFFDGTQAPLLYVNSGQIAAIAPFDLDGKGSVSVRADYQGVASQTVSMNVARTSPGIFTQDGNPKGAGLILNSDYTFNSKDNPAAEGSSVCIYWTGGGQTDPASLDGQIILLPLARPRVPISVRIGGKDAALIYAGAVPYGWAGLLMAEVTVPAGAASTDPVPVVITADGVSSPDNTVVMWVRQ